MIWVLLAPSRQSVESHAENEHEGGDEYESHRCSPLIYRPEHFVDMVIMRHGQLATWVSVYFYLFVSRMCIEWKAGACSIVRSCRGLRSGRQIFV